MADYASIKQDVIDLINRTDITSALAGTFVNQAQRKIARTLRLPSLEKIQTVTVGTTSSTVYNQATGQYTFPNDFLELVYIYDSERIIERAPLRDFIELTKKYPATGRPRYYTRKQNKFEFIPRGNTGQEINVVYFSDPADLTADTDTNIFTEVCPDLLAYGAVLYASDYFNDSRKAVFEDTYNKIYAETASLAADTDKATADAAVRPSFDYAEDLLN